METFETAVDDSALEKTKQLIDLIRRKKEDFHQEILELKASVSSLVAEDLSLIDFLYWNANDLFLVKDLEEITGFEPGELREFIGPRETKIQCRSCEQVFSLKVGSITFFTELKRQSRKGYLPICPKCEADTQKQRELNHANWISISGTRLIELRTMPYKQYLLTPEWKETRSAAVKRAKYKCQLCNLCVPLQVHHRTYERRGEEIPSDVIALCANCHAKFHDKLVTA